MQKKIFFQLFFFFITLVISIFIYKKYLTSEKIVENKKTIEVVTKDFIKDIKYKSSDLNGNTYLITAKTGTSIPGKPNKIKLENVIAKLTFDDNEEINVNAKFAVYDQNNYDTEFIESIVVTYGFQKINCENLNVLFSKNIAILKNNLIYENLTTRLLADQMEIDMLSRTSKIFMLDNNKKVKIIYSPKNGTN